MTSRALAVCARGALAALLSATLLLALVAGNRAAAAGSGVGDRRVSTHQKHRHLKRCRRGTRKRQRACARKSSRTAPVEAAPAPAGSGTRAAAVEPAPVSAPGYLRWAPPPLVDPIAISLGTGYTSTYLSPDRDYVIELPAEQKVGGTTIVGGHNVVILGGAVTIPAGAESDIERRGIYIKDATGTVHVEGVLIDGSGGAMFDGIDISAPQATVQLENDRIVGVRGNHETMHADIVQPWGGVKDLRIDRLTGSSDYQGLQLGEDLGPVGSAEISNVDLNATPNSFEDNGGYMLWLTKGFSGCAAYPVTLSGVFVEPRPGRTVTESVWPSRYASASCRSTGANTASWPNLPVTGEVTQGMPPGGSFVPPGTVGVGYRSPGYLEPN